MQRQKSRAHAGIETIQSGISSVMLLFSNVNREGGNAGNRGWIIRKSASDPLVISGNVAARLRVAWYVVFASPRAFYSHKRCSDSVLATGFGFKLKKDANFWLLSALAFNSQPFHARWHQISTSNDDGFLAFRVTLYKSLSGDLRMLYAIKYKNI